MTKQTEPRRGVPLKPDWSGYSPPPHVARAAVACARHRIQPTTWPTPADVVRALWPGDKTTLAVLERAATAPHSTATESALAIEAVAAFLGSLAAISAAASLFAACPRVSLGEFSTVKIPGRADPFAVGDTAWVEEGGASPVRQLDVAAAATLGPMKKMLAITAASRELVEASDAETILDLMLRESASYSLDLAVFSAAAGSSARPAGLLAGISALTASSATDKSQAMHNDLAALVAAVAANATNFAFVMHAQQAAAVRLRYGSTWDSNIPIWPTIAAAAGVVICIDPAAVVSAFGSDPEIRASRDAALHFEDVTPLPIGSPGTPPTVAAPTRSLWQTDSVSLKLMLRAAWTLRTPAIAWLQTTTW